jgi:hypothetical protein
VTGLKGGNWINEIRFQLISFELVLLVFELLARASETSETFALSEALATTSQSSP